MGRTKRRRDKKKREVGSTNLKDETIIINLKKWMRHNSFTDPLKLEFRNFPETGRGVTSSKRVLPSNALIRVPFKFLITIDTVLKSKLVNCFKTIKPIKVHSLLALFLIMERHKKNQSCWKCYLDSLPYPEPFLPWMAKSDEIENYPEGLKAEALKLKLAYDNSFEDVKNCFDKHAACLCCNKSAKYLINEKKFRWAYTIVNTRSVYLNHKFLKCEIDIYDKLLADRPNLALCPYLDQFNHHYLARTSTEMLTSKGENFYEIITERRYEKYDQIFISYGAHSNEKLVMHYGFFIPGNHFDAIILTVEEITDILKVSLNKTQAKIAEEISNKTELYLGERGPCWGLEAILFVCSYPNLTPYSNHIYSQEYPIEFEKMKIKHLNDILNFKWKEYKKDFEKMKNSEIKLMRDFVKYKVKFVEKMLLS